MDFTQEHKNEIERKIVEAIIAGLENKSLLESQLSEIADFVLQRIDAVKNQDELLAFLADLSSKWSIFNNVKLTEEGEVKAEAENEVAKGVLDLAKSGKIDDAIDLAKTMTNT